MAKTKEQRKIESEQAGKQHKGFRAMTQKRMREICSIGGKTCAMKYGSDYMRKIGAKGGSL